MYLEANMSALLTNSFVSGSKNFSYGLISFFRSTSLNSDNAASSSFSCFASICWRSWICTTSFRLNSPVNRRLLESWNQLITQTSAESSVARIFSEACWRIGNRESRSWPCNSSRSLVWRRRAWYRLGFWVLEVNCSPIELSSLVSITLMSFTKVLKECRPLTIIYEISTMPITQPANQRWRTLRGTWWTSILYWFFADQKVPDARWMYLCWWTWVGNWLHSPRVSTAPARESLWHSFAPITQCPTVSDWMRLIANEEFRGPATSQTRFTIPTKSRQNIWNSQSKSFPAEVCYGTLAVCLLKK